LVEDDLALANRLTEYLSGRGIPTTAVNTLSAARDLLRRHDFDVVVLDLNLGNEDGLVLARELSASGGPPVVITSSRVDEPDRVLGLELGADDYLVKPYSFRELLARLKAVGRRREGRPTMTARRVAHVGPWIIDLTAHRVRDEQGHEVTITPGEMTLLRVFLEHPDRVLLRHQIIALSGRSDTEVFDRAIDVLVGRLRRKLEPDPKHPQLIRTIRGEGYRLTAQVHWSTGTE
jgi:DNA-binding response OmpR family regulator